MIVTRWRNNAWCYLLVIFWLVSLGQAGLDLYTPSLPHIAERLHAHASLAKLTVSIYAISFGVFQIVFGPWSDAVGRRQPLLVGIAVFNIGSVLAALAPSIQILCFARLLQGIGASAASVLFKTLLSDRFEGKVLAKHSASVSIAWTSVPVIAPVIGGYIQGLLNWRANFWVLAIYGTVFGVFTWLTLPETLAQPQTFSYKLFWHKSTQILRAKVFWAMALAFSAVVTVIISFGSLGSFLLQNGLQLSAIAFGHWSLVIGLAAFLGSLLNKKLLNYFHRHYIFSVASIVGLLVATTMFLFAWVSPGLSLTKIVLPIFMIVGMGSLVAPNMMTYFIILFKQHSGTASAWLGMIGFLLSGLYIAIAGFFHLLNLLPLSTLLLFCTLLICIASLIMYNSHKNEGD